MKTMLTKGQVSKDTRDACEIDVGKEPDLYFAKLALEHHGNAIRDNTVEDWVEIGMAVERGDE